MPRETIAGASISAARRQELATEWRQRADWLDAYAAKCRNGGDWREAEDAEATAVDYRQAADELEVASSVPAVES